MSEVPAGLRQAVIDRAGDRCEYCGLSQLGQEATFHIDHVIPRAVGGETVAANLALACVSCSLRKGARQFVIDAETSHEVPLFSPRADDWAMHFRWNAEILVGLSPIGRATIAALQLNRPMILAIRREESERGRNPPA
jgi:5-methylcytosine-specific restriction endonuclease McrA